jgi:hypothetical protein
MITVTTHRCERPNSTRQNSRQGDERLLLTGSWKQALRYGNHGFDPLAPEIHLLRDPTSI